MKNKNLILFAGAAAVAAYFLLRRKDSGMLPGNSMAPTGPAAIDKTDAVIDADKAKISLPDAIEAVSAVSDKIKDLKVLIKKDGQVTEVRTGKKQKKGKGQKVKKTKTRTKRAKGKKQTKAAAQSIAKQAMSSVTKAFEPSQGLKNVAKQFSSYFPTF